MQIVLEREKEVARADKMGEKQLPEKRGERRGKQGVVLPFFFLGGGGKAIVSRSHTTQRGGGEGKKIYIST